MTEDLEERLIEGLGELKRLSQEQIRLQTITNGRIGKAEARLDAVDTWRSHIAMEEQFAAGFKKGSADTLITGRQLKIGVAVVTTIASLSGAITALIARFVT